MFIIRRGCSPYDRMIYIWDNMKVILGLQKEQTCSIMQKNGTDKYGRFEQQFAIISGTFDISEASYYISSVTPLNPLTWY